MRSSLAVPPLLSLALGVAGCGPSTDYSCRTRDETTLEIVACIDYQSGFSDADVIATCDGDGEVSVFRCPEGARARCVLDGFTQYYYEPFSLDYAQMVCAVLDGRLEIP
ncbi:MAG: hypothetical protein U0353_13685 [Sandaracinus sp.]